ncbi:alpha/beta hydrolase [Algoriphagus lutimaris]|uniref:alpha/beta fold hydrolase n=1 Tax=Algoriphagus lutimaris TaxID=613197 RepID=UPI00196A92B8|nr:alpha/beta hydrolase [Algoriphagus lutimaris]MBN3521255.1 alpha/beta hydrolase [Algoriphagus lutimaris]
MSGIEFFEKGQGQPIVLIHGFCEIAEMWSDFANSLSKDFRIICPNLPGIGNSKLEQSSLTMEEIAVLLENWLEEEGILNPIVIGHSLGGYVTLALTELMGHKLKAIGLFHSTAFADSQEKKEMRDRTVIFLQKYGVDTFVTSFVPPLFPENRREELYSDIQLAIEQGKNCSLEGLIVLTKAMRDRKDRMEVLENFQGSKLMIAGELDAAVPIEASRKHQEAVTNYVELPETGHVGMIERKEETIEIIRSFGKSLN